MKVIVAGSRTITDLAIVARAIRESGFDVTEVVSGGARGIDRLGECWAAQRMLPAKRFPADWPMGRQAGILRNREMAAYADALVAVWNGRSRGTANMISEATRCGLKVFVKRVDSEAKP